MLDANAARQVQPEADRILARTRSEAWTEVSSRSTTKPSTLERENRAEVATSRAEQKRKLVEIKECRKQQGCSWDRNGYIRDGMNVLRFAEAVLVVIMENGRAAEFNVLPRNILGGFPDSFLFVLYGPCVRVLFQETACV